MRPDRPGETLKIGPGRGLLQNVPILKETLDKANTNCRVHEDNHRDNGKEGFPKFHWFSKDWRCGACEIHELLSWIT